MSLGVRINIPDDSAVLSALSQLALSGSDKTALLDEIGINLVENARLRFIDQTDPDGNPWKQSARAAAQGGETLRDTGRLMNSITHSVGSDFVEYGTNVAYAMPLHFGAEIRAVNAPYLKFKIAGRWANVKEVTLPARPFIGLSTEDEQLVVDIIETFLSSER